MNTLAQIDTADITALTNEDIAAVAYSYRRVHRRSEWIAIGLFLGGLGVGLGLMLLGDYFGWSDRLDPVFFGLGWAIALGANAVASLRTRKSLAEFQLRCSHCDAALFQGRGRALISRADLVVTTRACPSCGGKIPAGDV